MEREKHKEVRNAWLIIASSGFLAVVLGAFGAHALESRLDDKYFMVYHTAVSYQFYHTFAMATAMLLWNQNPSAKLKRAFWSFAIGLLLFCGSLYLYAFTQIKIFGLITPFGGLSFLVGWGFIFFNQLSCTKTSR